MAKGKGQKERNGSGRFQWLVFMVVPVVFALTITLFILSFTGVDVLGIAKKAAANIPVISSVINEEEASEPEGPDREKLLQEEIETKNEEIKNLKEQNQMNERTIEGLNQDVVKLRNRIEQEAEGGQKKETDQAKNISRSFNEMDTEAAAAIMENMEQDLALMIMENVPAEERGAILEAMEPALAAELTGALLNAPSGQ